MALRKIRLEHDPLLRKKSKIVKEITQNTIILLGDMLETMYQNNGVGLAAPQVGVLKRIIVIEVDSVIYELINPEIIETDGEEINSEGCLSVPEETGFVSRPTYVKVKALNKEGKEVLVEGQGLLAIALCHEIDHLDGILYIDKIVEGYEEETDEIEENEIEEEDDEYKEV